MQMKAIFNHWWRMAPSLTDLSPSLALEQHCIYWGLPKVFTADMWHGRKKKWVPVIKDEIERVHFGSGTCYRTSPATAAATGSFSYVYICILRCCWNKRWFFHCVMKKKAKFSVHHVHRFLASVQFSSLTGCFTVLEFQKFPVATRDELLRS